MKTEFVPLCKRRLRAVGIVCKTCRTSPVLQYCANNAASPLKSGVCALKCDVGALEWIIRSLERLTHSAEWMIHSMAGIVAGGESVMEPQSETVDSQERATAAVARDVDSQLGSMLVFMYSINAHFWSAVSSVP